MVAIVFGSTTMNTEFVSQRIAATFGGGRADLHNVRDVSLDLFTERSALVLVSSTWGSGDLQDDWESFFPRFQTVSLAGTTVGLVGVGDQENYPDTFCDGIAVLYAQVIAAGGKVVGFTDTTGYNFRTSRAVIDGRFMGLILDEDNQADLSDERIRDWVRDVSPMFP